MFHHVVFDLLVVIVEKTKYLSQYSMVFDELLDSLINHDFRLNRSIFYWKMHFHLKVVEEDKSLVLKEKVEVIREVDLIVVSK